MWNEIMEWLQKRSLDKRYLRWVLLEYVLIILLLLMVLLLILVL